MRLRGLARHALAVVVCLLTIFTVPALAQEGSIPTDELTEELIDKAIDAVKEWTSKGRGGDASGALFNLLQKSDRIICESWLISYHLAMTDLSNRGALMTDEGTQVVNALHQLKNRIEIACQTILNDGIGTTGGGGGTGTGEGSTPSPPSACPECDELKAADEQTKWLLERARLRAERARARTAAVATMWATRPDLALQNNEETLAEAERAEERAYDQLERAQKAYDAVHAAYVKCLEACHARTRQQYGWLDRNKKIAVAAAAVVATAVVVGGGGGTPTVLATPAVQTPPPVATTAPTPPAQTTPAPTPAPPSPAGNYRCTVCSVASDPDRHEAVLRFCVQLINAFIVTLNSPLRVAHPAPWVTTDGDYNESARTYLGNGTGSVGSFQGVSSRVQATFQQSGDTITGAELVVTLGENGVFPGGRPVTYNVRLAKQ